MEARKARGWKANKLLDSKMGKSLRISTCVKKEGCGIIIIDTSDPS